jgi:hypothetical protein
MRVHGPVAAALIGLPLGVLVYLLTGARRSLPEEHVNPSCPTDASGH